ncbi:MAG: hypothetical protein ABI229_04280, partial [Gemmatimonadaceae bacterium]
MAPLSIKTDQDRTMKPSATTGVLGTAIVMACASIAPASGPASTSNGNQQPAPANAPTSPRVAAPTAAPTPTRTGSWTFRYSPAPRTYTIIVDATVAPVSDTTQQRSIPRLSQTTTIAVSATGDVQVIDPVTATSGTCDTNAALVTMARQVIPKLPTHLSTGDSWRDSTVTSGCRGTIPAESTVISKYQVIGDTIFAGVTALQIQRADSISATGEGADGQHRILISASGTGTA